jgi:hypothetical protein
MMVLDLIVLTFLFLFTLVVMAIVLVNVYRAGRRDGECLGAAREEAKAWRNFALAQANVAALSEPRADDAGEKWELPDQKPKEDLPC